MISAENYTGDPHPISIYKWSPLLRETGHTITYWEIQFSRATTFAKDGAKIKDMGDWRRHILIPTYWKLGQRCTRYTYTYRPNERLT